MRGEKSGQQGEGGFESQHGTAQVAEARQSHPQIEMAQGKKMLQADGEQGFLRRFFVAALPQVHHGQTQMRFRAVAVDVERFLKGARRIVQPLLAQIGLTDSQMQVGQARVRLFGSKQAGERLSRLPSSN